MLAKFPATSLIATPLLRKLDLSPNYQYCKKNESPLARHFYNQSNDDYLIINFPFKIGLPRWVFELSFSKASSLAVSMKLSLMDAHYQVVYKVALTTIITINLLPNKKTCMSSIHLRTVDQTLTWDIFMARLEMWMDCCYKERLWDFSVRKSFNLLSRLQMSIPFSQPQKTNNPKISGFKQK